MTQGGRNGTSINNFTKKIIPWIGTMERNRNYNELSEKDTNQY